jgi:hypothetical protein
MMPQDPFMTPYWAGLDASFMQKPPNTPDYLNLWSRDQIAEVVARWDRD